MTQQQFNEIKNILGSLMGKLENLCVDDQVAVWDKFQDMTNKDGISPVSREISNLSQSFNAAFRQQHKEQDF